MNDLCSMELLRKAVSRGLTADEESVLHAHLDQCESCCAHIEQLAGGETWQQEAVSLLTSGGLDDAVPETATWSDVDFGVEHLDPSHDANLLGQLGGYDVIAVIGRGGMGIVLKAFDRELKRFVAIKVLSPHLAHSSVARKRFAREAQAAAAVVNPHVIAIHHVQPTGRLPFLIMPLLTGESLAQRLKARGPLELTEVLRIGMQASIGLAAAHDQGLVHRDVKPANFMLEKGVERVVITDFGLARAADDVSMTRLGYVAGTPEYMSPEQARGEALDGRSDLFSLGCVLYEMATGVSPFRADSTMATLRRIVDEEPAAMASLDPELPPWFNGIVERLLAKDPAQRFDSAGKLGDLLEVCLSHLQQPATVPLPASLVTRPQLHRLCSISRLSPGVLAMFAAFGLAMLGLFFGEATVAPDITGRWTGERWGAVVLEMKSPGEYVGTYTETFKGKPGTIQLTWSARDGRFNGTWQEGRDCHGKISVRLVKDEVRGAWTTSQEPGINSGRPELAELSWVRPATDAAVAIPGIHVKLRLDAEKHSAEMLHKNIGFDRLSIMGSGVKGTIEGKPSVNLVAALAHRCRLESFEESGKKYFEATVFVPQGPAGDDTHFHNRHLSQKLLDQMQEEGVQFWLDHHRDQLPDIPKSSPQVKKPLLDSERP